MEIHLITTDADFSLLAQDWNRMCEDQPLNRHEWLFAWWKQFGRRHRLAIITVSVEGRIVAIAPWYIAQDPFMGRIVRFLGSGKACTDYQRILCEPDFIHTAILELARYLASCPESSPYSSIDRIELEGVTSVEPTVNLLVDHLQRIGFTIQREALESCWATLGHCQWEPYVESLTKRMRRKLNKSLKRIEQTKDLRFYRTSGGQEIARKWPMLVELHQKRFRDMKGVSGCFACHDFTMFLLNACKQLANQGMASIYWAEIENRPIVAQLHLYGKHVKYMYQSGFDDAYADLEPGFLLYSHTLRELFSSGRFQSLDFLRGNEKYKSMWSAQEIPLWRVHCISSRWTSRLRQQAYVTGRKIKRLAIDHFWAPPASSSVSNANTSS